METAISDLGSSGLGLLRRDSQGSVSVRVFIAWCCLLWFQVWKVYGDLIEF